MEGGSVGSLLWRLLGRVAALLRARGIIRWSVACCAAVCLAGGLVGGSTAAEGQEGAPEGDPGYSAYADPEKPAIAFILSEESNAEAFRSEFDLDDEEMGRVLSAVREENEVLARAHAENEAQDTGVPDFNERVREAVAETKASIEAVLPEDRRPQLEEWVDTEFAREGREAEESAVVDSKFSASGSRVVRCRVYASYYNAYTRYEVALPHKSLKFRDRYRKVRIRPVSGGKSARAPVKEVGPWNTRDDYWQSRKKRDMWDDLKRCVPEAQAAYFRNYNRGRDEDGDIVTNPAGVDLTLAVAKRMGVKKRIQRRGVIRVYVRYPWVRR
jgi:hypothetical protein